jgi:hypothetical protein
MTYRVLARFDALVVLTWPHFVSPVTLNFLNTKNIREIKVDASTKNLTIEPISVKSEIMRNPSDDLFFLKEKFMIVFVEGQKGAKAISSLDENFTSSELIAFL